MGSPIKPKKLCLFGRKVDGKPEQAVHRSVAWVEFAEYFFQSVLLILERLASQHLRGQPLIGKHHSVGASHPPQRIAPAAGASTRTQALGTFEEPTASNVDGG
eukprot:TRINITY_DN76583_c0_g1_i1.p1 TRINITY_DN76583_c0_g1~~TRINITY_DN76583_c0_g1_i1.p1  ORF type:complete len:112 (+),score=14.40 TRINITY_DN76583_c0_g1_i1:30-338(+)